MKQKSLLFLIAGLLALLLQGCGGMMASEKKVSHLHMGHVDEGWKDTPGGVGLLTILAEEVKIAAQHAGFAAKKLDNLAWMKTHTRHVRHAIDPSLEPSQKIGRGYGVIRAAKGVAKHIGFSSGAADASKNVKLHSVHVKTSALNVESWATTVIIASDSVLRASTAEEAAVSAKLIQAVTERMLNGFDANGDGKISWKTGEGGVPQAKQHMGFMRKGEGMG